MNVDALENKKHIKKPILFIKCSLIAIVMIWLAINIVRAHSLATGQWGTSGDVVLDFNYWGTYDRYYGCGSPIGNSDVISAYFVVGNVLVMLEPGSAEIYTVEEFEESDMILKKLSGEEKHYRRY